MKKKKYSPDKAISRFLVGSYYLFDVRDPLGEHPEITNTSYGHTNTIKRLSMKDCMRELHHVFDTKRLKWRSLIDVEFRTGTQVYSRQAEIVWFGLLRDCEGEYQQAIEDIFSISNMDHYHMTHVKAEVIGFSEIKDSDFTISKSEAA